MMREKGVHMLQFAHYLCLPIDNTHWDQKTGSCILWSALLQEGGVAATPARKNWVGQKQISSATPLRLLQNHFFAFFTYLKFFDKQLSQATILVTVAFLPMRKSKSI